jgi:hypothetical protein
VYSRGKDVEKDAYYFIPELEEIIRRWIIDHYMVRPHRGLRDDQVPGVIYTPQQRLEAGIARAGLLRIPVTPDLAYDFLPVKWRTIQHYGVEIDGLRYNGEALDAIRDTTSPHGGSQAGKWPFRVDHSDRRRIFFYDPTTHIWHRLEWIEVQHVPQPFSTEVLKYARRIARDGRVVADTRLALRELLARWDAGRVANPKERRMWLRLAETMRAKERDDAPVGDVGHPCDLATITAITPLSHDEDPLLLVSDDDNDGDFYADAFGLDE